jgi:RNA polymerase sigma-70 factor (ECF subfamily)
MAEPDDRKLMTRYGNGDAAAFEQLYRRHKGPLFRYFVRRCGQRELAEELFQEVWTRVINSRSSYQPTAKFTTWLYTLAQRCLIDHARHTARRVRLVGDERIDEQAASGAPDAAREVDADYVGARFANALAALPAEQRDAFLLHEESGLTLVQIAEVTGTERETVKSRLRYALRKLRGALADVHDDLTGTA